MANFYDYDWKHNGISGPVPASVRFTKPLKEGSVFVNLHNGYAYNVVAVSGVNDGFKHTPRELIRTSDAKPIPEDQLKPLRAAHQYPVDPEWPYLILTTEQH